jgi:hypothetical protein
MRKFNPGLPPQLVAVPVRRLNRRNLDKAIKKLSRYFQVENDLEQVARIGEYYGYSLATTDQFVFIVEEGSEFADIAVEHSPILELAIREERDGHAVVIL